VTRIGGHDVVVVGCGIAGMSAAVAAAQSGARVVVIERAPREERGGNTRYTSAFMLMKSESEVSDTMVPRLLECAGGALDPTLMDLAGRPSAEWPAVLRALSFADPETIATLASEAGATIAWLSSFGVRFDLVPPPHQVGAGYLAPRGGGLALIDALAADAEARGVDFLYDTTAMRLLEDEHGGVAGVHCRGRAGESCVVEGGAVVLGSGGFQGNPEMLTRYLGARAIFMRPYAPGGYYDRGEGIEMALAIGAAPAGEYASYHAQAVDPRSRLVGENAMYGITYGIVVDQTGRRFVDEAGGNPDLLPQSATRTVRVRLEALARSIPHQPGGLAYLILDAKAAALPNRGHIFNTDQPPFEAGTIAGLAALLAIPASPLERTVADFNAACVGGAFDPLRPDGLATAGLDVPKSHWARPLDAPLYQAYPIAAANVFTFGGLRTDRLARVIRTSGEPIAGLYAAGELAGLYYKDYTGATSVLRGAVFGRIAGADAAKVARARDAVAAR
jgi:tricarballylate dehydrogenase